MNKIKIFAIFLVIFVSKAFSLPTQVPEVKLYFETNNEEEADKKHLELKQLAKDKGFDFQINNVAYSLNSFNDKESKSPMPVILPEKINKDLRFHIFSLEYEYLTFKYFAVCYVDSKNNIVWLSLALILPNIE